MPIFAYSERIRVKKANVTNSLQCFFEKNARPKQKTKNKHEKQKQKVLFLCIEFIFSVCLFFKKKVGPSRRQQCFLS